MLIASCFRKGHAAPILYAAWAEVGYIPREELLRLRESSRPTSKGHPTPRLPFVDVATGSLGQGLGAGVGMALNARRIRSDYRTYVLMGDGETAEGSVWESAAMAEFHELDSLCGIVDVNGLGQSQPTQYGHDMDAHRRRWAGHGWHVVTIDGHNMEEILDALAEARATKGVPTVILAKTIKGKGVSFLEGAPNWHGKALKPDEMDRAIKELEGTDDVRGRCDQDRDSSTHGDGAIEERVGKVERSVCTSLGDLVATREAFGTALARLGSADLARGRARW